MKEQLTRWHGINGSVRWRLCENGVEIEGDGKVKTTAGKPTTVAGIWEKFESHIIAAATNYQVPVELIIATIATESGGRPNAERHEPGFLSYELTPHRASIGLMQTLISTARSSFDASIKADDLRNPYTSIMAGTSYIEIQKSQTHLDPPKVACAYNAGGIYKQDGAANRWKMRQYPIGTGKHADRFVLWFNDCFKFFRSKNIAPIQSFVFLFNGFSSGGAAPSK